MSLPACLGTVGTPGTCYILGLEPRGDQTGMRLGDVTHPTPLFPSSPEAVTSLAFLHLRQFQRVALIQIKTEKFPAGTGFYRELSFPGGPIQVAPPLQG